MKRIALSMILTIAHVVVKRFNEMKIGGKSMLYFYIGTKDCKDLTQYQAYKTHKVNGMWAYATLTELPPFVIEKYKLKFHKSVVTNEDVR